MARSSPRVLIGVLAGLMLAAMGMLVLVVWCLTAIMNGAPYVALWVLGAAASLGVFLFIVLLTMGVLYRVDRINRAVERRVMLFE